jgi:hypothetical protein
MARSHFHEDMVVFHPNRVGSQICVRRRRKTSAGWYVKDRTVQWTLDFIALDKSVRHQRERVWANIIQRVVGLIYLKDSKAPLAERKGKRRTRRNLVAGRHTLPSHFLCSVGSAALYFDSGEFALR